MKMWMDPEDMAQCEFLAAPVWHTMATVLVVFIRNMKQVASQFCFHLAYIQKCVFALRHIVALRLS